MRLVEFRIKSRPGSQLFFGKPILSTKANDETHEQLDARTWKEKVPVDPDTGQVYMSNFAIKNGMETAGKFLSKKIPGEGKKTYTDRIRKGLIALDPLYMTRDGKIVTIDDIKPVKLFVPSTGQRGDGKRVQRTFPVLDRWESVAKLYVQDQKLEDAILLEHLICMGHFVGLGSMRVENGGVNGIFDCVDAIQASGKGRKQLEEIGV